MDSHRASGLGSLAQAGNSYRDSVTDGEAANYAALENEVLADERERSGGGRAPVGSDGEF